MNNYFLNKYNLNPKWSRRDFLRNSSLATLGALTAGFPNSSFAMKKLAPTADRVILLWMAGGMAHTETFDPKKITPYKKGIRYNLIRSTFNPIDTVVDGLQISEGLENIAQVMDRATLIRSFSPPDLGHILHARHQYHWHTGYTPPQTIAAPHIGSIVAKTLGHINSNIPPFIHIGQRLDIDGSPEVKAFLTPGFLGHEFSPLLIPFPEQAQKIMSPPTGMTIDRFHDRNKFYKKLIENSPMGEFGSDYQKESLKKSMEDSFKLLSSKSAKAFDLNEEKKEIYDIYNTGRFGRGCLLARRLIEEGARFIEVTTEHVPFENWDTHNGGHERAKNMKAMIDRPVSQLILDLEERGLLDNTLVILASEFSRTATRKPHDIHPNNPDFIVQSMKQYGMHKHFTKAGSILMFGGGAKKGFVYGKSSDEVPCETIENPVAMSDFHATMYRALGIPADLSYEIEKRPFYVTEDGKGKVIPDLLSI